LALTMGLPETWYRMQDMRAEDRTLTAEDIRDGADVSDSAIFADAANYQPAPAGSTGGVRSHTDNPAFRRRMFSDGDNSDKAIFDSLFEDEPGPAPPYAGARSQHDRD
jgi:hypothetical protein